jgi:hypothetical protein
MWPQPTPSNSESGRYLSVADYVEFPLPDVPLATGDLFARAYPAVDLNPASLGTTRGLRIQVR